MARSILVTSVVALLPSLAAASAIIHVRTDQPSMVYIDGQLAGPAPLSLTHLRPGRHRVEVVNSTSSAARQYLIFSPGQATLDRTLDVRWLPPPIEPAPAAPEISQLEVIPQTPVVDQRINIPERLPVVAQPPIQPPPVVETRTTIVTQPPPNIYYVVPQRSIVVVSPYDLDADEFAYVPRACWP
jgi:hypothetical protein